MATVADELLEDFGDSPSEAGGDEYDDSFLSAAGLSGGINTNGDTAMQELREEDDEDEDDDMMDGTTGDAGDDPDEAKAKIEKMQLGGVRDVRAVAGLMKVLTPVLEVSNPHSKISFLDNVMKLVDKRLHLYFGAN